MESEPDSWIQIDDPSFILDTKAYSKLVHSILGKLSLLPCDLSIVFMNQDDIAKLNEEFREKNSPTDVLSFPQMEWESPLCCGDTLDEGVLESHGSHLGDIVICPKIAAENAKSIGQSLSREILFLTVHGLLHCVGHDHQVEDDEKLMVAQQQLIMDSLSFGDIARIHREPTSTNDRTEL